MRDGWVTPKFDEIALCGECTAYAGAAAGNDEPSELRLKVLGTTAAEAAQSLIAMSVAARPVGGLLE